MAELDIVLLGDDVLRQKAKKVTTFGPDLQRLIDDMIETLDAADGVGLAAPQVGRGVRVFLARVEEDPTAEEDAPPDKHLGKLHVVVNPEIMRASDELVEGMEGCLSIPGYVGDVDRHAQVTVRYQDRKGRKQRIKVRGWLARVFQHEHDHLDGVLYIDKAKQIYELQEDGEAEELDDGDGDGAATAAAESQRDS